ncbi:hypothetical protein [Campylobacter sp. RM16192]|uniref:hypothetical protein n=1 Tax=Campylobacter sp. RM16192 TaxID=1660080 RepID=UPI0014528EFC|nr:hypothetical protein [Campylobacter sp. RM16192]QCD53166.1 flagellar-associated protein FlgQ [Campylobacter sp. RM16192]
MARNFCILILFVINLFSSEEFILWAKFSTQNHKISYENFYISKAIVLTGLEDEFLCEIEEIKDKSQDALGYLNLHREKLFECFISHKFKVQDHQKIYQTPKGINIHTTTDLTLLPIRFTIKFKPNSAIIGVFNDKKE